MRSLLDVALRPWQWALVAVLLWALVFAAGFGVGLLLQTTFPTA